MSDGLRQAQQKMSHAGIGQSAIDAFSHYYSQLSSGNTGVVAESDIEPLREVTRLDDIEVDDQSARDALDRTVILKLNGGLGTSMGLAGPKSMLPVREGLTFLDLIARQVLATRERYGVRLPLVLMNSFSTREASLKALEAYPSLPVDDLPLDFVQSAEPKLRADDLTPVEWSANPALEWCPPGHGDIYPALVDSGMLDALLAAGFRYAQVSNSDNLGASPDPRLAGWFAASGAPFAMEVCRRTANDRKGGHLAVRRADGHVILREAAQTAPADQEAFADETRHCFFNTNNLWLDLEAISEAMAAREGVLGLPLIRNTKTVDPQDPSSPAVIQIETAMGAALEVFADSAVIEVGRDRFVPVKKTNDLMILRSDCYDVDPHTGELTAQVPALPTIALDGAYFGLMNNFEERMPHPVSLKNARRVSVEGDVHFGRDVTCEGDVSLTGPLHVEDGAVLRD